MKASEFDGDLSRFLLQYQYQPQLTKRLDGIEGVSLTPELLSEIVLWKVNRFVALQGEQLQRIDALRRLKAGEHRQASSVLDELLHVRGVDLPMASTILRFRNPDVFQIIDRHAYRLYGTKYPLYTSTPTKGKIGVSFAYVDGLRFLCDQKGLKFETVDRVLYVFDKQTNGGLDGSEE